MDEQIFKLFVLKWRLIITGAIYVRFCVECGQKYFIFNGKGGRLQFGVKCQASIYMIYTLSLCREHSWRERLVKQETLTPPGHLVSPLVCISSFVFSLLSKSLEPEVDMHNNDCVICSCVLSTRKWQVGEKESPNERQFPFQQGSCNCMIEMTSNRVNFPS